MAKRSEKSGNGGADNTVAFDYIKTAQFRSIHADGAIGGITPNGNIHLAFYSERPAIPRRVVQRVTPSGALGDEVQERRESRNSIVRELDSDLFLSLSVAKGVQKWLGERIAELEKLQKETEN